MSMTRMTRAANTSARASTVLSLVESISRVFISCSQKSRAIGSFISLFIYVKMETQRDDKGPKITPRLSGRAGIGPPAPGLESVLLCTITAQLNQQINKFLDTNDIG